MLPLCRVVGAWHRFTTKCPHRATCLGPDEGNIHECDWRDVPATRSIHVCPSNPTQWPWRGVVHFSAYAPRRDVGEKRRRRRRRLMHVLFAYAPQISASCLCYLDWGAESQLVSWYSPRDRHLRQRSAWRYVNSEYVLGVYLDITNCRNFETIFKNRPLVFW